MDFNINDAITEYSSSLNDLGIVFDSNNRDTESEKSFIDYSDKPILPQSFSNLTNEDIDNTVTTLDQAKYASYKKIDKNNFFESTACNWKQVNDRLEKDPDYTSDSGSKYWYTDKGVYRLSDHWGFGVGSCDWLLNEDPELSWRDESGKRLGYADFSEFKDTSNNSFPEIFEILTEKDANIGDKDQESLVTYYNYMSDKDELPTDFMQDTVYNAPIETQIYSNSAEDSTQSINVVDKVTENVVDSITEKVNPQVSGQGGSPKTYTNKKPGETTLKNYAFEVSTIDKIAEEMVVEADLESKKPYLLKDLEKSNYDKKDYDEIIEICNGMDPTGNRAVFTQWILRRHALDGEHISNDDSLDYLQKFIDLKNSKKLKNEEADINHYKSFSELRRRIDSLLEETGGAVNNRTEKELKENSGIKFLDSIGDYSLYLVDTYEAARKEFKDSGWCVAYPDSYNAYSEVNNNFYYIKKGNAPLYLYHEIDAQGVNNSDIPEEDFKYVVKLLEKNNLLGVNTSVGTKAIEDGIIQKGTEEYTKVIKDMINSGNVAYALLHKIINYEDNPEEFDIAVRKCVEESSNYSTVWSLLSDKIVTKEQNLELFNLVVEKVVELGGMYNLLSRGFIDKNDKVFIENHIDSCTPYCLRNLLINGYITQEDGELFDISMKKLAEESTTYLFDVIYSLGLESEYKNYLDGVEVTSGFKFVKISDFIQDFNRQDELTDDQLNRFLNRLPITEVNKDEKEKLKEDAKKVNKVITNIPKNLNAPFLEDEMGTNVLFYGDMDWMEMSDLSEM